MRTDQLVEVLARNVEPVDGGHLRRALALAVSAGGAATICLSILILGTRDFGDNPAVLSLLVKLGFSVSVIAFSFFLLTKFARPGGEWSTSFWMASVPFVGIIFLTAISLGAAPRSHWEMMILGHRWLECLISIPVIATAPFVLLVCIIRAVAAPTDLVRTGAITGLISGALSAVGYALHCTDDSVPFVALWFGGTIALCTVAGALLGPRVLRW